MFKAKETLFDPYMLLSIVVLVALSLFSLKSFEPRLFPQYYLIILVGALFYFLFSKIDFIVYKAFKKQIYVISIAFLTIPLMLGQVTRGTSRWILLGDISLQPSEIVKPFLMLFLVYSLIETKKIKGIIKISVLGVLPILLIWIQPSFSVSLLLTISFVGILIASPIAKKKLLTIGVVLVALVPLIWGVLQPYQKNRILSFMNPGSDPLGSGYNSIQSMISVGSGGLWGRGFSEGVQTQLRFLPEKHTDFIFAAIAEEMGFVGVAILMISYFAILVRLLGHMDKSKDLPTRMFISGVFLMLVAQIIFNIGMNLGLFPVSGIPLPLVSAGGSSFLSTMILLGMVNKAR